MKRNAINAIAHAWGLHCSSICTIAENFVDCRGDMSRKKRSDTGKTIFNSKEKQCRWFTPFNEYKKKRSRDYHAEKSSLKEI
mmetsp:Transcript_12980/g.18165  ORF Transcript_12980/g.18165 Transcript_12980/m.18165 type:complete len:82 (-) Transcript_12980:287-532(-)